VFLSVKRALYNKQLSRNLRDKMTVRDGAFSLRRGGWSALPRNKDIFMQSIQDFYVAPGVVVTGDVDLSPGANIWFGSVVRGDLAKITIGPRVNIQDGSIVHTDHKLPQDIEEGVVVGHRAVLHGRRIGRDTLVGMGALLLTGCEIGEECLIAAGAIVTEGRRIPPRSVVMGVPGKVIREITPEELQRTHAICASYLELAQRYARNAFPPPWTR
jgi:carbonic anhydrase/acetyltransferase-like protein (isoleucine patch superfamily)